MSEVITASILTQIMTKFGDIVMTGKKIPQLVRVIHEPRKYRKTLVDRATRNANEFTELDSPSIEIKNPRDIETMIKSISLVPDATFKTNGRVRIFVNEVLVLEDTASGDWTDILDFVLDFEGGKTVKAGESVKALMLSSSGTSALSLVVTFGD